MTLTASLLGAVLSFVVLTVATYASTKLLGSGGLGLSVVTAALTSLVWFGVTYVVSGYVGVEGYVVALGPLLAVVGYVLVVDLLHRGTVVRATAISLATWVITFAILYAAAALFGYSSFEAIGVPPGIV
jgi:hypothetical protein